MRPRSMAGVLVLALACASTPKDDSDTLIEPGPVDAQRLRDGSYTGNVKQGPNRAVVRVHVEAGQVTRVEIVSHRAWKGVIAEQPVTEQIVERQSTQVDVISGATNSSEVLMKASQAAVERSYGDRK